jgi:hypothetical protein
MVGVLAVEKVKVCRDIDVVAFSGISVSKGDNIAAEGMMSGDELIADKIGVYG